MSAAPYCRGLVSSRGFPCFCPLHEEPGYMGRREWRDITPEDRDFLDRLRSNRLAARGGHEEHRLDIRIEPLVHSYHLKLVFEIGHRAQAAHDHRCTDLFGK